MRLWFVNSTGYAELSQKLPAGLTIAPVRHSGGVGLTCLDESCAEMKSSDSFRSCCCCGLPRRGRLRALVPAVFLVLASIPSGYPFTAERVRAVKIGVLTPVWGATPQVMGLRDGLEELGYREDEHFVIGVRFTQGNLSRLPAAARSLVAMAPDLIVAHDAAALPLKRATTKIPIVFVGVTDPVDSGVVKSFAHPGGNITGVSDRELQLGQKRLEVFAQLVPGLKRVLFLYDPQHAYSSAGARVYRDAARRLGIELIEQTIETEAEAQAFLGRLRKDDVDGILRPPSASLNIPGFILEASAREGIPTMFNGSFWVEQGALASYGPNEYASGRQAARLVDRILKGATPAEVPVELNDRIEFVINLKVSKALGLKVAPEMLYQADNLIR